MSAQDLIDAAIALLAADTDWCQGATARKSDGLPCAPGHPDAVSWDIVGALRYSWQNGPETSFLFYNEAYDTLRGRIPSGYKNQDLESWNDSTDYATVMDLLNDTL